MVRESVQALVAVAGSGSFRPAPAAAGFKAARRGRPTARSAYICV